MADIDTLIARMDDLLAGARPNAIGADAMRWSPAPALGGGAIRLNVDPQAAAAMLAAAQRVNRTLSEVIRDWVESFRRLARTVGSHMATVGARLSAALGSLRRALHQTARDRRAERIARRARRRDLRAWMRETHRG